MFIEEIKNIKSTRKDLKKFGITMGIVALIIAAFFFYKENSIYNYFVAVGGVLILLAYVLPVVLKPFQLFWMTLAVVLGFVMTRIILSILFYLILTPTGLIAKLIGKKFMPLEFDKQKESYWEYRELKEYSKSDTEKQF